MVFVLIFLLVISPGAFSNAADSSGPTAQKAANVQSPPSPVTFNKEIAPLVFAHCSGCHRPGQSAPFSLLTYHDVQKRAKLVGEVVQRRYMPPWLPVKGHGDFANDRSLKSEQIALIEKWLAQGAVEGDTADLPATPKWTDGWQLGKPDLVVTLAQPYALAAEGKDVYRNVVIPIPLAQPKFVKGVEFNPGNWKVVHHAFINVDFTGFSRRRAEKENPAGFDGMALPETATMPGGQSLSWQPGKVASFAPSGLSWALRPGADLVVQLHLHPTGKPEMVQPSVAFYFTDEPPTNAAFRLNLNPLTLDIPPGVREYSVEDKYVLPVDVEVLGILPHAHYLAQRMEGYALRPDGSREDLLLITNWDFNWQGDYQYAHPISLPKGTTLGMRFTYDNSPENVRNPNHPPKRVRYGLQTTDEMAELWLLVLPRNPADRKILGGDFSRHLAQLTVAYNEFLLMENPNDAIAHTRAGRAELYLRQFPQALVHLQAAVQADPNYDRAWYELGFYYNTRGQLREAEQAFQNVLRLNPDDFEAEGTLGAIFLKRGDLDRAETHFKAALRINPDDKIARQNLETLSRVREGRPKL